MVQDDLRAASRLHAAELPEGFLAQLGPRFLRSYLATFLDTPGGVALVVDDDRGQVTGFLVGSTRHGHHRAALRLHARSLALAAVLSLVSRPVVLARLLRTKTVPYARAWRSARGRQASAATTPAAPQPPAPVGTGGRMAVLLNVAVSPQARGRGVGTALVRGLEQAARADGCEAAELVSFGDKAFYEGLGWIRTSSRRNERGQDVVTYRRNL